MNLQIEKPRGSLFPPSTNANPASLATTHHRPSDEAPIVTEVRFAASHFAQIRAVTLANGEARQVVVPLRSPLPDGQSQKISSGMCRSRDAGTAANVVPPFFTTR
jgi:hypothetical protein